MSQIKSTAARASLRSIASAIDFLDGVAVALHQVGPDGTVLWANQAELDLLGCAAEEYIGRHIADFHADREVLDEILVRLAKGETLRNYAARLRARDGSIRDVLITSSAVFEDGELVNTQCATIDVTEQRRAQETSALLAAIVDSSDDAIISKSLDGIISSWNKGAERLYGYTAAEAIGRHITLIIPPELYSEEETILAHVRRGEKINHYETERVAKDGRVIDISLTISPVLGADGQIIGASKIARDITERRRAESALRESETRLRTVIDALPAAVYTTDAHGRVTHSNPAAEEMAGRTPNPDRDLWCVSWSLTRPDGTPLPLDECPMAVALKEGRAIRGEEIVVQRPDGGHAWAAAYPTPLRDSDGNVTGAINMLVDITERKRFEEALKDETLIAETLNRAGSMLAAELDLERIVQFLTDEVTAVTTAEFGAFFYNGTDRDGEAYQLFALAGAPREAFDRFAMPRNTPLFEPTFRGDACVRLDDVTRDVRYGRSPPHYGMPPGHLPVRSYLAVPVVSRSGDVLGGLFLGHAQPAVFTERHERIVSGIAAQAAIAIDNANLYARVQESEQRFRQLAERITDVFWLRDIEAERLLYVSPAYEVLWGRTCQSLYDSPGTFVDAVHPEDRGRVLDAMERQRRGETTGEEYRVVHADGSIRWIWDRSYPIGDERGRLIRVAGIAEDVTERKLSEDRLRDSEERYRRLTELLPVAVYTCEAPGGEISFFNERAVELWGRAPATLNPSQRYCGSVRLFLPDGTPLPHDQCPMATAINEGRRFRNQEVVIERPDGSRIIALVNIEPIRDSDGEIVSAINACLDVTALKDAEARLREADRRKDEFLATLSHELRSPLAPLRHSLEIIKHAGDDYHVLAKVRETMDRQVKQMVRLIDDLLDVSRITHDKLELRKEFVMLHDVVQEATETSQPVIEGAGHRLTVRLPEQPVRLDADPVRLAQVVGNLLSNACKHMESGGEIVLTAELGEGEVALSVQDQGEGIPPEMLDVIFEMFAQANQSMERARGGLGIGLTLVRRLVEMHGGSVQALSDGAGRGSTFVVRLPLAQQVPASTGSSADVGTQACRSKSCRILVVDDNRDSADCLATLLSLAGYQTETAYDGLGALDTAEQFRPDVVLLDIGLPGMNGYDVCRAIRRQPWGKEMSVFALTGWGEEQNRQRSREAGFDHHLVKPVDLAGIENLLPVPSDRGGVRSAGRSAVAADQAFRSDGASGKTLPDFSDT